MKKTLALVLSIVMLLLALPAATLAAPEDQALEFNHGSSGAYFMFTGVSGSSNLALSFDLSMEPLEGELDLTLNNVVHFYQNAITINGSSTSYTWGAFETIHWRHVEIICSGNSISVNLDGTQVASATASLSGALFFLANRGHIFIDNFSASSAGVELFFLDFEDEGEYLNHKSNDSSVIRGNVPQGSYYDYSPVNVPDNASYIFDTPQNCAKLTVSAGVQKYRGDVNEDDAVDQKDLRDLKKIVAGDNSITYKTVLADVKVDDSVDTKDTLRLKKVLAGSYALERVTIDEGGASAEYSNTMCSAKLTSSKATTTGLDATLAMDPINAADYPYAVITYMTPNSTEDHNSSAANKSAFGAWGNLKQYNLTTDGKFHSEVVDLSDISTWNGDRATLRFFVAANVGDVLYVNSIIFCATLSKANAAKAEREAALANYGITDQPIVPPTGKIGYLDSDNNYCIVFDTQAKMNAVATAGNNTTISYADDAIRARATGTGDPNYTLDLTAEGISASTYKYIAYVYKNPNNNASGKQANIYYQVGDMTAFAAGYQSDLFGGAKSDNYQVAIVDLSAKSNWTGSLTKLRIDYFTDTIVGDVSYLDSIIFCRTSALAGKAGNERMKERNGITDNSAAEVWNTYRHYYQNANSYEFITGSQTNLKMYFRYGSLEKFTARSLGDRFARAIRNATGSDVTAEVYSYTFCDLRDKWSNEYPENDMFFTLRFNNDMYIIWVRVVIMKDSGYSDALDGTSADPYYDYPNNSTWASPGYTITDSVNSTSSSTYVAAHSNHENKITKTPYGTFAVHHTACPGGNDGAANYTGGGRSGVFRIYDNGSSRMIYEYDCTNHTTKPQIMYGDDGLVYFVQPDDGSGADISIGYFDPSQPNGDGSYNISYSRTHRDYPGGSAPGGYGYSCAYMDYYSGNIYTFYCGGRDDPGFYLCWMTYNYRTHRWVGGANHVFNEYYRQCYLYAFPDGAGGVYLVAERACLLECLGLQNIVYGANYTWDEIALFHIKNMSTGDASSQLVIPGDYTQLDRELFPNCHNASSDCYMTSDNKLHVIWQVEMHGRNHHDTKYNALWHVVYDCATPGQDPVLITKAPLQFIASDNFYTMRFVENTSGQIFLLAMPNNRNARCEVWKATNALATEFELVACKNFSDTDEPTTGMLVPNTRTHSIYDNKVPVLYPLSRSPGVVYKCFFVTLPSN